MSTTTACNYTEHHTMLRELRGKASEHACVDCGRQARDWSYDQRDPDEHIEWSHGMVGWRIWSADVDRYAPRCRRCHWLHDHPDRRIRRRTPETTAAELAILVDAPRGGGR